MLLAICVLLELRKKSLSKKRAGELLIGKTKSNRIEESLVQVD